MTIADATSIKISPVNMESRKKIGLRAGDTVRVFQKIHEKGKTRLQAFEGLIIARKHGGEPGATFTVRRVASGVGVEKIFPLYSPAIDKIEIVKRSKVRRAKLYHIRKKAAKEIKRQMRHMRMVDLQTESAAEEADKQAEEDKVAESDSPKEEKVDEKKDEIKVGEKKEEAQSKAENKSKEATKNE